MVYETINGYTCRKAGIEDVPAVQEVLTPLVCSTENHESMNEVNVRQMKSLVKYYITNYDSAIVEKEGTITGVYVGEGNTIGYLANLGDIGSLAVLLKVILIDLHNKFASSTFVVSTKEQREAYSKINLVSKSKAISIDEFGNGVIPVESKQDVMYMYEKIVKD